jgi:hypothetical protein
MKIISTVFILVSLCWQCIATEQTPDVFIHNGKEAELCTSWAYKSPLEHYFSKASIRSPFQEESTGNYRGHVAYWEIIDKKLFLKKITIETEKEEYVQNALGLYSQKRKPYDLSKLFKSDRTPNGTFAVWFSGSILVFIEPYKKTGEGRSYSIEYKEILIINLKEGILLDQHSFIPKDYYKAVREVHNSDSSSNLSPNGLIVKKYFDAQKSD